MTKADKERRKRDGERGKKMREIQGNSQSRNRKIEEKQVKAGRNCQRKRLRYREGRKKGKKKSQ